jgi:hypothetical protein
MAIGDATTGSETQGGSMGFGFGLLAGVAIGVAGTLMLSPATAAALQRRLKDRVGTLGRTVEREWDHSSAAASTTAGNLRDATPGVVDRSIATPEKQ